MRLVVAILLTVAAGRASGQADHKATAARLAELGGEALRQGNYAEALTRFSAAYHEYPSANLRYDLALAQDALGDAVAAITSYEEFLRAAPDALTDARVHAATRVEALRSKVARIELQVSPSPARVRLNDNPLPGEQTRSAYVAPGPVRLSVDCEGFSPQQQELSLDAGDDKRLTVSLERVVVARAVTVHRKRRLLKPTIALGSIAAATLAGGIIFGGLAQSESDRLNTINATHQRFDPSLQRDGRIYQDLEIGLLTVGGAASIATVVTLVVGRPTVAIERRN
jgi:tetratricopeptide (TPR) repeat protein